MRKIVVFIIVIFTINSCKSYKEYIVENNCGNAKKIYISKEKPFKVKKLSDEFILTFLNGFDQKNVIIKVGDSIYFDKKINTDPSTSFADGYYFQNFTDNPIKVLIGEECFYFNLDKNYKYYEIHVSKKMFYLHLNHFPSIGE